MAVRQHVRGFLQPLPRGGADGRGLLLITTLLVTFGTIAVASASEGQASANGGSTWSIMIHDLVFLGFGLFALYVMARVRLDRLVKSAPMLIVLGLALLLAVKAVGVTSNGGKRWLNLHVIYLQPSELFKLGAVVFVAWFVQHHHDQLGNWRQLALWSAPISAGCALVVIEPDIGTSSVIAIIAFAMLAVGGLSRQLLGRIAMIGAVAFGAYMAYKPYSARRFFSFLHPNSDLVGSGYQLLQSRISLGAGGVGGLGLGQSRGKWGLLAPSPSSGSSWPSSSPAFASPNGARTTCTD
jgi:cell division protein FtsW